jgi:hypothetical protein
MKHNDNAATQAFKSQVDRMQDYFKAAGVEVPRTHLMEAAARFNGARDWRTLRAELESKETPKGPVVPSLAGKCVRVYFEVQVRDICGDGPQFCWTDVDQRWVNRMYELSALCKERNLSELDDDFDSPDWMDDGEYRITNDGITVSESQFWFYGTPKHAEYKVETDPFGIDELVKLVQNVSGSELFLLSSTDTVYSIMDNLARDDDHPNFVNEEDPCVINVFEM